MQDHFHCEPPTPFTLPHLYALALDTSVQAGFPSPAEDHAAKRIVSYQHQLARCDLNSI